ncbi:hypothetical protein SVIOM74S_08795 [Streptomyces violarus]
MSSSRRSRPGAGSVGASGSPDCLSSPTVARSSLRAERLASRTWARASLAWSGRLSMTCAATPAWTLTRAMWWATTSCRSRAIRRRSSATRRRASSSRVRSARSARSRMAWTKARRLRTASPAVAPMPVQAKIARFSWAYQGRLPAAMAEPVSTVMVSRPTRQVVGRSVVEATVYRAMTADMATGARGSPVTDSMTETVPVRQRTVIGARRRKTRAAAPRAMRRRLRRSGVRRAQLTLSRWRGSTNDPATMQTRTPAARTASMARGCALAWHLTRWRVLTGVHGSRGGCAGVWGPGSEGRL